MTTTNEHTERAELIKGLRDLAESDFDNLFMRAAAMLEAQPDIQGFQPSRAMLWKSASRLTSTPHSR